MKRIAVFVALCGIGAYILYGTYVDGWNFIVISMGTLGSLENGFVIGQTILIAFLAAVAFGMVVTAAYSGLSYLFD